MDIIESKQFLDLKVGDVVTRFMSRLTTRIEVTRVQDSVIECGTSRFSRKNGAELDDDLGWDDVCTGAYIKVD